MYIDTYIIRSVVLTVSMKLPCLVPASTCTSAPFASPPAPFTTSWGWAFSHERGTPVGRNLLVGVRVHNLRTSVQIAGNHAGNKWGMDLENLGTLFAPGLVGAPGELRHLGALPPPNQALYLISEGSYLRLVDFCVTQL